MASGEQKGIAMMRIVNVSGGNGSALSLLRVIDRYGTSDVLARFADTKREDPSLYRFLDELELVAGVNIERLSDGRDIWDVFQGELMFTSPANGGCIASHRLKKLVLRKHLADIGATPETSLIYIGYDITEPDRCERLRTSGAPWQFEFPLHWPLKVVRCDIDDELRRRGLSPCDMYERGYDHANCGGTCVLAGAKQWSMVLRDYPERFNVAEKREADTMRAMADRGRVPQSILKDRRGGRTVNLPLSQLRREVESGERPNGDENRINSCSCMGNLFD